MSRLARWLLTLAAAYVTATIATTVWVNRVYLPRIAGAA